MGCRMDEMLGEGQIWYLNPKNYARRIYRKRPPDKGISKAATAIRGPGHSPVSGASLSAAIEAKANGDLDTFHRLMAEINERELKRPGTQVVPLQDCFAIIDVAQGPLLAMMCICRYNARGEEARNLEEYSCMGLGTGQLKWERWPERYRGGAEFLSPSQAKEWMEYWDKRGYVHIIMLEGVASRTIAGLCNCDYPTCHPIRHRLDYGQISTCVKAECVAKVDYERCNGCGDCVKRCQFAALRYEVALDKANINPFQCFGCGLCATICRRSAIELIPRERFPVLANVW